jgi:hypothetical protein
VTLSAEDLLAGSGLTFEVEVPSHVLRPGDGASAGAELPATVRLRPLTVADLQTIVRAAKESDSLTATLMVHRALVEPELTIAQLTTMHIGLLQFLLERVNELSGVSASAAEIAQAVDAPLAKATFVLAEEFGWTPQEVGELTLGQILLHLKMLGERPRPIRR